MYKCPTNIIKGLVYSDINDGKLAIIKNISKYKSSLEEVNKYLMSSSATYVNPLGKHDKINFILFKISIFVDCNLNILSSATLIFLTNDFQLP